MTESWSLTLNLWVGYNRNTMIREETTNITQLRLLDAANQLLDKAYAPYSHFRVGASLVTPNGRIFSGCNVENASFGLTVCAERNAVFQMVAGGEREISSILIASESDMWIPPCGACLQVLAEFSKPETKIWLANRAGNIQEFTFSHLMPQIFTLT